MWLYLGFVHIRKLDSHFVSTILVPHSVFLLVYKGEKKCRIWVFYCIIYLFVCMWVHIHKQVPQHAGGGWGQLSDLCSSLPPRGAWDSNSGDQATNTLACWATLTALKCYFLSFVHLRFFFPFNKLFEVDVSEEFWDCLSSLFETESYVTQADLEVKLSLSPHVIKCWGYRFTSMLGHVYDLSSHLGLPLLSSSCSFPVVCQRQLLV